VGSLVRSVALRVGIAAGLALAACGGHLLGAGDAGPPDSGQGQNPADARGGEPSPLEDTSTPDASGDDASGDDARGADGMTAEGGGPSDVSLPPYPDGPLGTVPGRCSGPTPPDTIPSRCYSGAALVLCGAGTTVCIDAKLTCDKGGDASPGCGNVCEPDEYAAWCSLAEYEGEGGSGYPGYGGYGSGYSGYVPLIPGCRRPSGMGLDLSSAQWLCCPCGK
jgi:hypothetical protein